MQDPSKTARRFPGARSPRSQARVCRKVGYVRPVVDGKLDLGGLAGGAAVLRGFDGGDTAMLANNSEDLPVSFYTPPAFLLYESVASQISCRCPIST